MRRFALLLLAACGPVFAPVKVRVTNAGRAGQFMADGIATLKLNSACTANCELRGGLTDGGVNWVAVTQRVVDAGDVIVGLEQPVEIGSTLQVKLFVAPAGLGQSFTSCDAGMDSVPRDGVTVAVSAHPGVAGGECSFEFQTP